MNSPHPNSRLERSPAMACITDKNRTGTLGSRGLQRGLAGRQAVFGIVLVCADEEFHALGRNRSHLLPIFPNSRLQELGDPQDSMATLQDRSSELPLPSENA